MRKLFDLQLNDGRTISLGRRTAVVGVLNITPDSFSDGGVNLDAARAIDNGLRMEEEGADIVEVGGESTRPGAAVVTAEGELSRVLPVVRGLAGKLRIPISVDTYKSRVARAVVDEGARILNDVSALRFDPEIADVAARARVPLVLMHMRGEPATMQKIAPSADIFLEIERDITAAVKEAERRGVGRSQIVFDPGIGFGKTLDQNLAILNHLSRFESLGLPIMIGTSRKSFIGRLTGRAESDRVFGTAASVASAIIRGAHIVRVHDVKEMAEVARVTDAIINATAGSEDER
ncbi:MAG TPA: dihydropteroate synthase [Blastocatellia bacterium]|nr:dihydropteroate synthase [Blastocatellia bacterium]